jgi:NAD(P)-dependent dehydrogenase (short-subunit alcohol dehydrogenase family)
MSSKRIGADLTGRRILITGASSGIGAHFGRVVAAHGGEPLLCARRLEAVESLAQELRAAGGKAAAFAMDVRDTSSVKAAVDAASQAGNIDALVNNSGIAHGNPLERESDADWDDVIATNLTGARNVAVEVARHMIAAGKGGSIVNIASILGMRQGMHVSAYATSKAGLVQLTKQMALEWARHRIRVNALAPGYIDTPINDGYLNSEAGKAMIKRIPQRRIGTLDDLDGPLLLLLSEASSYMTGAIIPVDGGHLLTPL